MEEMLVIHIYGKNDESKTNIAIHELLDCCFGNHGYRGYLDIGFEELIFEVKVLKEEDYERTITDWMSITPVASFIEQYLHSVTMRFAAVNDISLMSPHPVNVYMAAIEHIRKAIDESNTGYKLDYDFDNFRYIVVKPEK